jgi:hypothetical protein
MFADGSAWGVVCFALLGSRTSQLRPAVDSNVAINKVPGLFASRTLC